MIREKVQIEEIIKRTTTIIADNQDECSDMEEALLAYYMATYRYHQGIRDLHTGWLAMLDVIVSTEDDQMRRSLQCYLSDTITEAVMMMLQQKGDTKNLEKYKSVLRETEGLR